MMSLTVPFRSRYSPAEKYTSRYNEIKASAGVELIVQVANSTCDDNTSEQKLNNNLLQVNRDF